jgi:hypothetical protein
MVSKKDVLDFIRKKCVDEGLDAKPRIYELARDLKADKDEIIEIVKKLEAEGIVKYVSDVPSESHICPVDLDYIMKQTAYEK